MGRPARRILRWALVVIWPSSCVLYTDRINEPPVLVGDIQMTPAQVLAHSPVRFTVGVSDADGDAVSLSWSWYEGACGQGAGASGGPVTAAALELEPASRKTFCVRVVARDARGAEARALERDVRVTNRPPEVVLTSDPPGPFPLYARVRLDATRSTDPDRDSLAFTWQAQDAAGAPVVLGACDQGSDSSVRCVTPERSGAHSVTVRVSDGEMEARQTLALTVAEDRPPCIETTDPDLGADTIVLTQGVIRSFEVRRVSDDGNPYPPSPRGETTFVWSLADGDQGSWVRQSAPIGAAFAVGSELLPGARPGSTLRVRVEARDPLRDRPEAAAALEAACQGRALCESPPGCFRWVSWRVRFQ